MKRARARRFDLRDEDDLRAAYDAHGAELYRFALRQLSDEGAAGDVVQDVFLRAWRSAERFDPEIASLRVWLYAIARNAVVDQLRRHQVRPVTPASGEVIAELAPLTDDFVDDMMMNFIIEEALRRLSPQHRTALVETYLRGRSYDEVAGELGVPVGTVRTRVFYGLKALRLTMDDIGAEL